MEEVQVGKYLRKETYPVERILPLVGQKAVDFDGDIIKLKSIRYQVFRDKGCVCVKCGLEGTFFAKERNGSPKYHFNLYGYNERGDEVQLTKDHDVPASKGGSTELDNLQPMCLRCNGNKGNKRSGI